MTREKSSRKEKETEESYKRETKYKRHQTNIVLIESYKKIITMNYTSDSNDLDTKLRTVI